MKDAALASAFFASIADAKPAGVWFVSLVASCQRYGGSEEGGWWYDENELIAYQQFSTEEDAEAAAEAVKALAGKLTAEAVLDHSAAMSDSIRWLNARGLDADYLPEPDSETTYHVVVTEGSVPSYDNSRPHWE